MFAKKGQLSVETMIIYGLVILVAISVIGALIYFDILDLGAYLPDTCDIGGTGDLKCEEMKFVAGGDLELGIRNIGQKPIEMLKITVTDEVSVHFSGTPNAEGTYGGSDIGTGAGEVSLPPGEMAKVTITPGSATTTAGKVLRGTLKTEYLYVNGVVTQEAAGNIRIKAT